MVNNKWIISEKVKKVETPSYSFKFEYNRDNITVSILDSDRQIVFKCIEAFDYNNVGVMKWFNSLLETGESL